MGRSHPAAVDDCQLQAAEALRTLNINIDGLAACEGYAMVAVVDCEAAHKIGDRLAYRPLKRVHGLVANPT